MEGPLMITIDEDQLVQVEYLIQQSTRGLHVLFDPEVVRKVFRKPRPESGTFSEDQARQMESHIEQLLQQPTLTQKRAYLERLKPDVYEKVLVTYFHIVENNMYEKAEVRH